ncbi:DUF459 domain-containing protein [Candidatus Poriferisocius sp.]|uniref:DUF459 domain-containing protein n=1 Tax=Candidatus Poriferisocius sp. TaxID=3101276 RepID=UPI003B5271A0
MESDGKTIGEGAEPEAMTRHTNMGRRISLVVLLCLVSTTLLTSGKLLEIAERQPLGESRDRWVSVAEAVDRAANFLSFNRPYDLIADWRGLGQDVGERLDTVSEVVEALEVEGSGQIPPALVDSTDTVGGPEPEPTGVAAEFAVVSPDRPLRVHVAGDSQADEVGHALEEASGRLFDVTVNSRNSTSLVRPDYFNWPAELLKVSIRDDPDVVVLFLGASEWQNMETRDGSLVEPGAPEWLEEWSWRLSVALDVLSADHRLTVWVGLPPMRLAWSVDGVPAINAAAAAVIADYPQSVMVDIWDLFGGESYVEKVAPPSGGSPVRVRMDDGVHLNRMGSSWVSDQVVEAVAAFWDGRCDSTAEEGAICWRVRGDAAQDIGSRAQALETCAELPDGGLVCWTNDRAAPLFTPPGEYLSVSASWNQVCARRAADSTATCWGDDLDGRGNIPGGAFESVVAGAWHACGIRPSGQVQCWGTPVANMALAPTGIYTEVTVGERHSCALKPDGRVDCWGDNEFNRSAAPDIEFVMVSAGRWHSCGIVPDLSAVCWGDNSHGQADPPGGQFASLSAGEIHSCGLRTDGSVNCWGANSYGETEAPDGEFASVATGERHSCGLLSNGEARCWGNNDHGRADPPAGVFLSLDAGGNISCGLRFDQSVECWGRELAGESSG